MIEEHLYNKLKKLCRKWEDTMSDGDEWGSGYEAGLFHASEELEEVVEEELIVKV
jgi:hypothetical protein